MAESLCGGSAAPLFKRPRLEISSNIDDNISSFDSLASTETFYHNMEFREAVEEVTSSSDPPADINGGDSGFHDLTPPNSSSIDSTSIYSHQGNQIYVSYGAENGDFKTEADSSELLASEESCKNHPVQLDGQDGDLDDNDAEEVASTISDLSGLSDLSNQSGHDKASSSSISWVHRQMQSGANPRMLLMEMLPRGTLIPSNLDEITLWRIILNMLREPPPRSKLLLVNTLEDVVNLLRTCQRIIVLTGAGVSVSCGIPDFRSRNGIYARLSKDYPDLPDPQAMFDIHYFRKDPRPFFKFAKEIYPGQFEPSPSHRFIQVIEKQGKLLRNYTQNIDTLEQTAGIQKVITCHGSFASATCTRCCYKVGCSVIKEDIFKQRIPFCPRCPEDIEEHGIMKPDIVFFGEGLSDEFHTTMAEDRGKCDLLIVMGSSLKVRPVALIPGSIPPEVPQILINREPLKHLTFDVELLGDCDVITGELCKRLQDDWGIENPLYDPLKEITDLPVQTTKVFSSPSSSEKYVTNGHSEVNNNAETFLADTTCKSSDIEDSSHTQLPPNEESNSCDYRGLSAIRLEDSQDGTSQEMSNSNPDSTSEVHEAESTMEEYAWLARRKESLATHLPENTYLFVRPSRYIFHGAEVYSDGESDVASYTGHYNSSSDSDSSSSSEEDDDDNNCETLFSEETSQSHTNMDNDLPSRPAEISEPRNSVDSECGSLSSENSKDPICS